MRPGSAFLLALACLIVPPAVLAGPGGTSPPGSSGGGARPPVEPRRLGEDVSGNTPNAQRTPGAAVDLEGRVTSANGSPLAGIVVKAFANGLLLGAVETEADGEFTLSARPMHEKKGSAVVWFESPDPGRYLDACVVLWADPTAEQQKLFPECEPHLNRASVGKLAVTMLSADEQQAAVIASRCLEGGEPTSSP
ncbi:MAG: carboxypeptidase-like regulatory domain-containing protein [bacterium]